ncbi:MAG TPA: hypothetical protein VFV52_08770 [Bacilli bacterium]|nr:hypothetical protein [Bacilli bacterium]
MKRFFSLLIFAFALFMLPSNSAVHAEQMSTPTPVHFDVTHSKKFEEGTANLLSSEGPNQVVIGSGGGCGGGATNTGWTNHYSRDRTSILQTCSFDAGYHTMITQMRIYTLIAGDLLTSANALATYDDGSLDSDYIIVGGTASQAFLEVEHSFSSGGYHSVTIEGGFESTYSTGYWSELEAMTLQ